MKNIEFIKDNRYMREKRKYYVYIHTCPNGKCYIGMSITPKNRWNNGNGYKGNKEFYKDILKYGWDNIEHEILIETHYGWIARGLEKDLITKYRELKKAYNMTNELRPAYISQRKIPFKKIGKYTKDGILIKEYNSATEAYRDGNPIQSRIQACCRGTVKTSGGFIWKYI